MVNRRATYVFFALALPLGQTWGQGTTVLPMVPGRAGYAFEAPRILAQQQIFGLAHGIGLLAQSCRDHAPAGEAYDAWQMRQASTISDAQRELAHYYFKEHAEEATWMQIARAIGLKATLTPSLSHAERHEACTTLPAALARPRYDLSAQFELQRQLNRLVSHARLEGKISQCRRQLASAEERTLDEAVGAWQRRHGAKIEEANTTVLPRWQDAGMEMPFEQWQKKIRKAAPAPRDCEQLSTWLATPAADPDSAFRPRP